VKKTAKTISIEEKLYVINWHEEGEQTVDIGHNVRFAHSSAHTKSEDVNWTAESAGEELKCLCV
jgi:hypothetical protein